MKTTRFVAIGILVACLSACGTVMRTPESAFLTTYAGLSRDNRLPLDSVRTLVDIDPARIVLGDFEWRAGNAGFPVVEQEKLLTILRKAIHQHVAQMPASPAGRPAVLRAAITRVIAVSPSLNTLSALLIIVPIDRGGAAVEIEAIDADTGKQLAALRLGYYAPLSDLKARFSKLAPAEIAIKKAADNFALLLQPTPTTSRSVSAR